MSGFEELQIIAEVGDGKSAIEEITDKAQQFSEVHFMRIYWSYLVNFNRVTGLILESRKHYVQLKGCYTKVPVSRSKVAIIKERLGQ